MHHSADKHLKQHRKIPGKVNHWKPKSVKEVIESKKEDTDWLKINKLRSVLKIMHKTGIVFRVS